MLGLSNPSLNYAKTQRDDAGNIVRGHLRLGGNLRAGLFVKDRWMLGVNLGYYLRADRSRPDFNSHSFNLVAFSRHYFPLGDKLSFFAEGNIGYNLNFFADPSFTFAQDGPLSLGADVGVAYQWTKRFSIEASMGYRLFLQNNAVDLLNRNPNLGLNFHF